ncbi:MAG: hypothetical protein GuLV1_gp1 [Guiyang lispivirus 1]|uniref:C3H1-type domain-containing protein n=1 Tax=Guiyang lispivirus 1 TaxID=2905570 RepID=A0AAX2ZQ47_9MONO|nr:MAG: hypothetical protein QKV06_gp1 [Guiyang lispivirus 1]UHK03026.1 MAG: hypothetical protein GuLV1_gp1 [Guiyang lispivirus 1]
MANQDKICKFFENKEACPYGSNCEDSHDIFTDDHLKIISKQLDSIIGGMSYIDQQITNLSNDVQSLNNRQNKLSYQINEVTLSMSTLNAACRHIGVPITTGVSWDRKSEVDQIELNKPDLTDRAQQLLHSEHTSCNNSTINGSSPFVPHIDENIHEESDSDLAEDDLKDGDILLEDNHDEPIPD